MRSLTTFFVLLVVFMAPGSFAHAQGTEPASKTDGSVPVAATKEEVNQLRSEVAAQRKTIEELKAMVEKLAEGKASRLDNSLSRRFGPWRRPSGDRQFADASSDCRGGARLMPAVLVQPDPDRRGGAAWIKLNAAAPKKEPR